MRVHKLIKAAVAAASVLASTVTLHAQQPAGTAITYQGRLTSGGVPFNGTANLRFELWDAAAGGAQLGAVDLGPTHVADGLFTAPLDFGAQPFSSNSASWLQVVVDGTPLSPRQALTAAPFSLATRGLDVDAGGNVTLGAGSPGVQFNLFTGPGTGWINFGSDMNFDGGVDGVFYLRHTGPPDGRTSFVTNNDEHLTIRNSGRIGIGETDPSHQLVVRATGDADAIYAVTHASSGERYAIVGQTWSPSGAAVRGDGSGGAIGVYGSSDGGVSVFGDGSFGASAVGGFFRSFGESGKGVHGAAYATTGLTYGVYGEAASPAGFAGYFSGRGYFSSSVGIGTHNPSALLSLRRISGAPALDLDTPDGSFSYATFSSAGTRRGIVGYGLAGNIFDDQLDGSIAVQSERAVQLGSGRGSDLTITESGYVGIGTNNPAQLLSVNGSAGKPGGGSWSTFCDARLKHNVRPLEGALDRLLQLRGYEFEYTAGALAEGRGLPGRQLGLIAQEVQQVFPDWVEPDHDGYLFVTERATTALMVESLREIRAEKDAAIADLQAAERERMVALEARLATLQAENDALRARLERIEKLLNASAEAHSLVAR